MKKIVISSALVLSLVTTSSVSAFAVGRDYNQDYNNSQVEVLKDSEGNEYKVEIIKDNKLERTVRITTENSTIEATYDKMKNILKFDEDGVITEINLEQEEVSEEKDSSEKIRAKRATSDRERIESTSVAYYDYYYKIYEYKDGSLYWDIGNGKKGKYIKQTKKNKNDLYNYQDQLDELLRREAVLALSSAGAVAAAKQAISSARASWPEEKILASFAALGFAGWAGSNLLDIFLQERKVKRAFRDAHDSE
ncbi:hypothetical protein C2W64_01915 [Brevibacillus laterosporus]|nr:geobacillin-26 family protein [Brevibacillus laterosporus]RAP30719.1 hypothetical protein C2W64_01915 [Brevibacillus laterosporus]